MELTLRQIYFSYPVLSKLVTQEMPIKVAFKIGKIIKTLGEEFEMIEKQRVALVNKHGEKSEEGIKVPQEKTAAFVGEFEDFLKEKTNIFIEKINPNILPDDIKLSPRDSELINFLFDQELYSPPSPKLVDNMC